MPNNTLSPRSVERLSAAAETLEALGEVLGVGADFRWAPIDAYRALESHASTAVAALSSKRIRGAAETIEALNSAWDDRYLSWSPSEIRRAAAQLRSRNDADRVLREEAACKLAAYEALRRQARAEVQRA